MSFCTHIKDELSFLPTKSPCCRKSLIHGLIYGASLPLCKGDGLSICIPIPTGTTFDYENYATTLLKVQYGLSVVPRKETRGAHKYLHLSFDHKQLVKNLTILSKADQVDTHMLTEVIGFRCDACQAHFLRGVFLATGTVNDPAKSYHLEMRAPADGRADLLCAMLLDIGSMPGSTRRRGDVGFIWKSSSAVIELLTYMGTTSGIFDIYNTQIEREIRNNENRATNCDTVNIGRSMSAASKHMTAITYLEEQGILENLPLELQETAQLRLLHSDVSLSELAELHTPPITKSGLNHRLQKLLSLYQKAINN